MDEWKSPARRVVVTKDAITCHSSLIRKFSSFHYHIVAVETDKRANVCSQSWLYGSMQNVYY
jgi:hypothetical protein